MVSVAGRVIIGGYLVIIRFLGTHNSESRTTNLVSFLIDDVLAVDAGSLISELSFSEQEKIKAILLSHGHYDHIRAIPALAFNNSQHITKVFALRETLEILSSHLLDGVIYPRFAERTSFLGKPALELIPLEPFKPKNIEGYRVLAVPVPHTVDAVGFEITSGDGKSLFYTGDTGPGLAPLWDYVSPQLLITDVTYPNKYANVAGDAGHLCPAMLKSELAGFQQVKRYLPRVVAVHLSPQFEKEIGEELDAVAQELAVSIGIASEGETLTL